MPSYIIVADGSELPEDFFVPSGGSMDTQPPPELETPWHRTRQEQNEVGRYCSVPCRNKKNILTLEWFIESVLCNPVIINNVFC